MAEINSDEIICAQLIQDEHWTALGIKVGVIIRDRDALKSELASVRGEFKNFHRNLCERFDYFHDERDWKRDQISLEEHIAKERDALKESLKLAWVALGRLAKTRTRDPLIVEYRAIAREARDKLLAENEWLDEK